MRQDDRRWRVAVAHQLGVPTRAASVCLVVRRSRLKSIIPVPSPPSLGGLSKRSVTARDRDVEAINE
jgi:hypothetical protein